MMNPAGRSFVTAWLEATGNSPSIALFQAEADSYDANMTWAKNAAYAELLPAVRAQLYDLANMYRFRAHAMREAAAALQREGCR